MGMRLSSQEITTIKGIVRAHFGQQAEVWLFGSRIHDEKRGGDIDLLVRSDLSGEAALYKKFQAMSDIQLALGDQKIDMVLAPKNESGVVPLVVRQALSTGVPL